MRLPRRAMALPEVMISATILLLMLGVASLAMVAYGQGTRQLLSAPFGAHDVALGLERSLQLLSSTQQVLAPPRAALEAGYSPEQPAQAPLVLRVRTALGLQDVGLSFDPSRQQLVELSYPGGYDPQQPYPNAASRRELGPAQGLRLQWVADRLELRVEAGSQQLPWLTAWPWKGIPCP